MSQPDPAQPPPPDHDDAGQITDLPPALLRLMRQIARDCRIPGRYHITIEIPASRHGPRTAVISRLEQIRVMGMEE